MDQTLCREQFTERLRSLYYKSIKRILIDLYARSSTTAAELIDKGKDTNTYRVFQNKLEALPRANAMEIKKMYDTVERKAGSPELLSNLIHNVFTLNLIALIPDFSETLVLPGDRTIFHRILAEVAEEIFPMPYIFDVSQAAHDTRIESDNKIKSIIYNSINAQIIQILLEIITPYQARQKLLAAQAQEEKEQEQEQESESDVFDTKKIDGVESEYESEEETNVSVKLENSQVPQFTQGQEQQNMFAQAQHQAQEQQNMFAQAQHQAQEQQNMFAQAQPQAQEQQNMFAQPQAQEQQNMFAQHQAQEQQNMFAQPQEQQNMFAQPQEIAQPQPQEQNMFAQTEEIAQPQPQETQDMTAKLENFLLGPKSESNVKDDRSDVITIKV